MYNSFLCVLPGSHLRLSEPEHISGTNLSQGLSININWWIEKFLKSLYTRFVSCISRFGWNNLVCPLRFASHESKADSMGAFSVRMFKKCSYPQNLARVFQSWPWTCLWRELPPGDLVSPGTGRHITSPMEAAVSGDNKLSFRVPDINNSARTKPLWASRIDIYSPQAFWARSPPKENITDESEEQLST